MRFTVLKHNCYSFQTVITWLISPCLLSFLVIIQLVKQNISSNLELRNLKWNNFSMHLSLIKFFPHRIYFSPFPHNISPVEMWLFSTHNDIPKHCIITGHLSTLQQLSINCKMRHYHPSTELSEQKNLPGKYHGLLFSTERQYFLSTTNPHLACATSVSCTAIEQITVTFITIQVLFYIKPCQTHHTKIFIFVESPNV